MPNFTHFWELLKAHLTTNSPSLPQELWLLGLLALSASLLALSPRAWRYSGYIITVYHEAGHALAALLTGKILTGVTINLDQSGETRFLSNRFSLTNLWCSWWGYPFAALTGLGYVYSAARGYQGIALTLSLPVAFLMVLLIRNFMAFVTITAISASLALAWWFLPAAATGIPLYCLGWFLLAGSLKNVVILSHLHLTGQGENSDATSLWHATLFLPPFLWIATFYCFHAWAYWKAVESIFVR